MASVSVLDDVLAALLTIFQAAVGTSVPVYDGLPATSAVDLDFVLVGDDGDPANSDQPAGTITQERVELDGRVTEVGDVTCCVISQTGDDDLPGRRASSRALMLAVETAIRADRTLGGVVTRSNVADVTLWQARNERGSVVRRVFTVHYDAFQR